MDEKVLPNFDKNGNLPPGCYKCNSNSFKKHFVDNFKKSKNRPKLHEKYLRYIKKFSNILIKVWIDGSYTTSKIEPQDVDLVVHYDALKFDDIKIIDPKSKSNFKDKNQIKKEYGCHTFGVPVYPKDDYRYMLTKKQSEQSYKWFTKDRNYNDKGIIEIEYVEVR